MKNLILAALLVNGLGFATLAHAQSSKSTPSNVVSIELPKKKKKKDVTLELFTNLRLRSLQDEYMSSQYGGGVFEFTSALKFTDYLNADLVAGVFLLSGNHTNYYNGEGKAPSAWYIDVAAVNLNPVKPFTLSAGLVPIQLVSMNSTYLPGGLPGIAEKLNFNAAGINVTLTASQVIPPIDPQKTRTEAAKGASMTVENIAFKAGDIKKDSFADLAIEGAHFLLRGMNASPIGDNVIMGNTAVGSGDAARFAVEFEGYEVGAKSQVRISNGFSFAMSAARVVNMKAPRGDNEGFSATIGPKLTMGNFEIAPSYTRFYTEADVLPASFTNPNNSFTNRQGQAASLKVKMIEEDVLFNATWNQSNEITDRPYQSDRTLYLLSVETTYEIL